MLLKDYLKRLIDLTNTNESLLECRIVYSKDDEGNGYQIVGCEPEVFFIEKDQTYYVDGIYELKEIDDEDLDRFEKIILIN